MMLSWFVFAATWRRRWFCRKCRLEFQRQELLASSCAYGRFQRTL